MMSCGLVTVYDTLRWYVPNVSYTDPVTFTVIIIRFVSPGKETRIIEICVRGSREKRNQFDHRKIKTI